MTWFQGEGEFVEDTTVLFDEKSALTRVDVGETEGEAAALAAPTSGSWLLEAVGSDENHFIVFANLIDDTDQDCGLLQLDEPVLLSNRVGIFQGEVSGAAHLDFHSLRFRALAQGEVATFISGHDRPSHGSFALGTFQRNGECHSRNWFSVLINDLTSGDNRGGLKVEGAYLGGAFDEEVGQH